MAKPGYKEKEPLRPNMKEDMGSGFFYYAVVVKNLDEIDMTLS